jgi:hypothetical protein
VRSLEALQREIHWETHMEPVVGKEIPDVSAEQRASNDKIKLIRKLRWIGEEGEARRLQGTLLPVVQAESLFAKPRESD